MAGEAWHSCMAGASTRQWPVRVLRCTGLAPVRCIHRARPGAWCAGCSGVWGLQGPQLGGGGAGELVPSPHRRERTHTEARTHASAVVCLRCTHAPSPKWGFITFTAPSPPPPPCAVLCGRHQRSWTCPRRKCGRRSAGTSWCRSGVSAWGWRWRGLCAWVRASPCPLAPLPRSTHNAPPCTHNRGGLPPAAGHICVLLPKLPLQPEQPAPAAEPGRAGLRATRLPCGEGAWGVVKVVCCSHMSPKKGHHQTSRPPLAAAARPLKPPPTPSMRRSLPAHWSCTTTARARGWSTSSLVLWRWVRWHCRVYTLTAPYRMCVQCAVCEAPRARACADQRLPFALLNWHGHCAERPAASLA